MAFTVGWSLTIRGIRCYCFIRRPLLLVAGPPLADGVTGDCHSGDNHATYLHPCLYHCRTQDGVG